MIKRVYSQPTSKLLVVRFGGAILQASKTGIQDSNAIHDNDWDSEGWDELN